ncbi:hypothetical protein E2L00_01600 [Cedecea colo]|uniref:Uncharacterized protein n=2 Tax=Cedecea colo TaxID=2552946 RepID=A0ABX0VIQ3_9ENTR|nr:hypothetical protein [Cedecea colo]
MKSMKTISIFKTNENIFFMTCFITSMEKNKNGIKLMLVNGETISIKDYGYYSLSEAEGDLGRERIANNYKRFVSELSQMSEETITSLMP